MKDTVVFFFPWKEFSGGPLYLSGIANALSESDRYEVYYVDYLSGIAAKKANSKVHKIIYSEPFSFPLKEPVILITPIYCAPHIPILYDNSKILFLNWHNYSIQALIDSWRLDRHELQEFLELVNRTNSVFFADKAHWLAQNAYIEGHYAFKEKYIPIVLQLDEHEIRNSLIQENVINIAILGRLTNDKTCALINVLQCIDDLPQKRTTNIYIIGDGPKKQTITSILLNSNITIHMMGTLVDETLMNMLATKVDIVFAMGQSLLFAGLMGLPSVIIPSCNHPFHKDEFTYLHESTGFSLGWYVEQIPQLHVKTHSIGEILDDIYIKGRKKEIGQTTRRYCVENHSNNIEQFISALNETTLLEREFRSFSKKQRIIRLLGVPIGQLTSSFDETKKSIRLLGINDFFVYYRRNEGDELLLLGQHIHKKKKKKIDGQFRVQLFGITIPFIKL